MFKKGTRLIKHPEEATLVVPTQGTAVPFLNLDLYQARGMNNYRRAYEKDSYVERDAIMEKAVRGAFLLFPFPFSFFLFPFPFFLPFSFLSSFLLPSPYPSFLLHPFSFLTLQT